MRLRRTVVALSVGAIALVAGAESFCRYWLGLGDPPLTVRDPDIDYLFAPGRTDHRFGNRISYNSVSMRAEEVSPHKTDPNELRILVLGDSVINGGALTDDGELATRLAQGRLATDLKRPVWVGNASAGSWGPGNQLAYVRKYGTFDADVAIVVLGSGDVSDVPEFTVNLGPDFPDRSPRLAIEEAVERYLPRYVGWPPPAIAAYPVDDEAAALAQGRDLLRELLRELTQRVGHVIVLHHPEQGELSTEPSQSARGLRDEVEAAGVAFVELAPYLARAPSDSSPYRDPIHINRLGQRLYADALECVSLRALGQRARGCT